MRKSILLFLTLPTILVGSVAAALAYFLSVLVTGLLAFNLIAAAVALLGITYGLTRTFGQLLGLAQPQRWAAVVSAISIVGLAATIALPAFGERWLANPHPVSDSTIRALAGNTIHLTTVQPGSGFDDLQAIKPILEGKRIVALGEATHGTSEFFKMKHRLLEFLVCEMGYEHFGMETSAEAAGVINNYITGGPTSPQAILYWPWATEEVLDMLDWMRAYNTEPGTIHPIVFHGIDPRVGERDRIMAGNVARILEQYGPQSKIVLWAHNAHISNAEGWLGYYLKQRFGEQVYLLGFEFNQGTFTSRMITIHTYGVQPAPATYYAYGLAKVNQPILYLDFQSMSRDPELQIWLAANQRSHDFQELHALYRLYPAWHTLTISWLDLYDGLIFIEKSTPAIGLQ